MADNPQIFDIPIGNVKGPPGNTGNGISSIALLQTVGLDKTYRITMTDETHYDFTVTDGNGISGVTFNPETYTLTLTFDDGTSYTTGSLRGAPGAPGNDGISPAVTITTITGGHRVTITDRDHPQGQTFDVMDGAGNVTSVAGKTGAVTLDGNDISFDQEDDYDDGTVGKALKDELNAISQKQDAPSSAGTAGQVLGLDSNLDPVWVNQSGGGGMSIVNLSGTQITQVGADNTFYVCGELTELTFTAPAVGITMIRFTSGTTPTVCTINGVTKWMYDFDPTTDIEASKTYDINVLNGIGVAGWA